MSHSHANRAEEIQNSIREVFNKYWDPIGVADDPEIQDEYDSYIAPVYHVLVGSRLDKEIVSYLWHVETNLMGFTPKTSAHLQKVADRLLDLDVNLHAHDYELVTFASDDALAQAAANALLAEVRKLRAPDASYSVALSGGRIGVKFFSEVAANARAGNISFAAVHFFWADERCVPPNSTDSNFSVANELLLTPLGAAKDHVHRIRGEEAPEFACAEAEAEICRVASLNGDGLPVLDLVILGLGEDGHVASLFPGRPEPEKKSAYQIVTDSPKPPPTRITLSYDAIAAAIEVWVLVSGKGKEEALRESLKPDGKTPLRRVINSRERTKILSDVRV